MFAEEKPLLQPLPLEPFRYYQYGERTVHLDGCVEVEADRLLHHGHLLKCGPRSWRTKTSDPGANQ